MGSTCLSKWGGRSGACSTSSRSSLKSASDLRDRNRTARKGIAHEKRRLRHVIVASTLSPHTCGREARHETSLARLLTNTKKRTTKRNRKMRYCLAPVCGAHASQCRACSQRVHPWWPPNASVPRDRDLHGDDGRAVLDLLQPRAVPVHEIKIANKQACARPRLSPPNDFSQLDPCRPNN